MTPDARTEYGDIIDREHYVSPDHPPMSRMNRAAQFSPFAALTGYGDMIDEAARLTGEQTVLDESEQEELDRRLRILRQTENAPPVSITFFVPDEKKQGGAYRTVSGRVVRYDDSGGAVRLDSGEAVPLADIVRISADLFDNA